MLNNHALNLLKVLKIPSVSHNKLLRLNYLLCESFAVHMSEYRH